ncbi:MAG: alpha/beta hydrolase [Acidimicrobiaceae bacterium]|nr:alpha/beta hydrolase [Acidimicrobiaceae bacterium]MCS5675123.1 alpha/beta hydrolase [Acidimicrobiales bacterium]MEE2805863.1 alpha/beta hydrolase [Actinomycetota bacterium]|tara:strand:+ start:1605 stop:2498 length:894 start_codon:yes stop_codon:yes gene_type:complete
MASPEYHRIRDIIASRLVHSDRPINVEKFRANQDATARALPNQVVGSMVDAAGVPAEMQKPDGATDENLIVYFHGGGYVGGSIASHRNLTGHLALHSGCRVLSVEYRLAPEHPHPAAVEDAVTSYKWAVAQGYEPGKIALAGDSAGGGLTAACLLALRDQDIQPPAAAMMISPWLDMGFTGKSMVANEGHDSSISAMGMPRIRELFLGDAPINDPLASPLDADLEGLPPLLIQVGDEEVLLSDSQRFAEKANDAGVHVELRVWPEMFHVWHACVGLFQEAADAIDEMVEFVKPRVQL